MYFVSWVCNAINCGSHNKMNIKQSIKILDFHIVQVYYKHRDLVVCFEGGTSTLKEVKPSLKRRGFFVLVSWEG